MMPTHAATPIEMLVRLLARRAYTAMELRRKLYSKALFTKPQIEQAIHDLERQGIINDERYLLDAVRILRARSLGPARIRASLLRKGLDREAIDRVLTEHDPDAGPDPIDAAAGLLRKKSPALLREPDSQKRKLKAWRYLAARGFDSATVAAAWRHWLTALADAGDQKTADEDREE